MLVLLLRGGLLRPLIVVHRPRPFGTAGTLPFLQLAPGRNKFVKLGLTSVINPRIVNDFKAGFNRFFFVAVNLDNELVRRPLEQRLSELGRGDQV